MLQLKIVQDGTFEMTPVKGVIENRPTCSLIESKGWATLENWYTLIDLDHPINDSSDLVNALAYLGVAPQQIKVVILTHLHPDHIGHKDLFSNALFMFHKDEKLAFYFKDDRTLELEENADLNVGRTDAFSDFIKTMHMAMNNDDVSYYRIPENHMDIMDYLELYSGDDDNSDGRIQRRTIRL